MINYYLQLIFNMRNKNFTPQDYKAFSFCCLGNPNAVCHVYFFHEIQHFILIFFRINLTYRLPVRPSVPSSMCSTF